MNTGTYQFRLGDFDCAAVTDGTFTYAPPMFPPPADFLFVNAPRERLARALAEHGLRVEHWPALITPFTCLLVNTPGGRVLIDTGAGGIGPNTGKLSRNLASIGVEPEQIDVVVLTHGHLDHLGGNTDAGGRLLFPAAKWVMSRVEWEFWMEGRAEEIVSEEGDDILLSCAQRNLSAIGEQVELVSGEKEILPGVQVVPAPGHTPGHSVVAISSGGEELLCVADLVLHPIHLEEPEWFAAVDMQTEQLAKTRRVLLGRAEKTNSLVLAFHFPFPGLGRLHPKSAGWQWEQMKSVG
jgi:glyoxylase-like metal-dependent hydrolase (beta-lactamase superfamily II)